MILPWGRARSDILHLSRGSGGGTGRPERQKLRCSPIEWYCSCGGGVDCGYIHCDDGGRKYIGCERVSC